MYISFVGLRANVIMEKFQINNQNFVFHHADDVYDFWEKGLLMSTKVVDLMSEAVLLYTFSFLGDRLLHETGEPKQLNSIHLIKKYLDDHYTAHNFSLETMSRNLSYNPKYISYPERVHYDRAGIYQCE